MSKHDYRNTSFNNYDFELGNKKVDFLSHFSVKHPRAKNHYTHISEKTSELNTLFRKIYFHKCVYCGTSIEVIDSSNFEVDHFIPKDILKKNLSQYDSEYINSLENLVNSCKTCNRAKSNFICEEEHVNLIHPDKNKLKNLYKRKDDFSIEINVEYSNNSTVKSFYKLLNLESQQKRIEYFIMEMKDFCTKYNNDENISHIKDVVMQMERKKRQLY